jgi:hypothetical protein
LLALIHSACLRNARRISYTLITCGLSLHRNKQKQTAKKTKSPRPTSSHLTCIIVWSGEKQGNASVRFLGVCPVFATIVFKSICLLCIVPQYGRLAAIFRLLALNHCACLRNARRIIICSFLLWFTSSSEQTKTNSQENEITPTNFFTSYLHHRGGR